MSKRHFENDILENNMRSILERAIEHFLNEDKEKANALLHKFMVERARQIHEAIRQGDDISLSEGWDSELVSEEFFSDDDLDSTTDTGTDLDTDSDVDTLASDEDVNVDDADVDDNGDVEEPEDNDTASKLEDFEAELEKLTAEFKDMLSTLDIDDDAVDEANDDADEANVDAEDAQDAANDADVDAEDVNDADVDTGEDSVEPEVDESDVWEDFDLDDITESVIAELEKVTVNGTSDGQTTDGKNIPQFRKSSLPQKNFKNREEFKPELTSKPYKDDSFSRETPPSSKQFPHGKLNSYKKTTDLENSVKPKGDANAALNKDFAGGVKPTKSPIAGK